ncbi:MAG: hypothetical protein COA33_000640 [Fluviicola sp.]|nr:hypothetical protein [Fluviicola sp.]
MSLTDKEIDKLFQNNANNASFEYKDAYWKELEAMLPPKKEGGVLWLVIPLLFIGLLVFAPVINGSSNAINEEATTLLANNENDTTTLNEKSTLTKNKLTKTDIPNNEISSENVGSDSQAGNQSTETQQKKVKTDKQGTSSSQKSNNSGVNKNYLKVNNVGQSIDVTDSKGESKSDSNEKVALNNNQNLVNNQVDDKQETQEDFSSKQSDQGSIDALSTAELSVIEVNRNQELAKLFQDLQMPTRSTFYIQALGGLSQSMITPSDRLSYSMGVGIGANFNKGRFVFTTGLNGIWSIYDDLVLSRQAKVYGFGSEVYNYDLKFRELFSLEADLSIGYRFGNSTVSVGVRPSYIVGSKVNYRINDDEDNYTTENFYGYSDGIYRFGIKPMLGYSYDFKSGVTVGINIGAQIMPLVDAASINGENSVLPIDGQLYLRKSINFRK